MTEQNNRNDAKIIEYSNETYKTALILTLSTMFLLNLTVLSQSGSILPILAMLLQITTLAFIFLKHPYQVPLIKIWSGILIIGGIAGFVAFAATLGLLLLDTDRADMSQLAIPKNISRVVILVIGIYFYRNLKSSIKE